MSSFRFTSIHENLHWFVLQHEDNFLRAMKEIRDIYPKVKIGNNDGGARSEESTYVHIVVCYLEYVVLKEILGKRDAEQVVKSQSFYQRIYEKVLENSDKLGSLILQRCDFDPRIRV